MKFSELVTKLQSKRRSSVEIDPTIDPDVMGVAAIKEATAESLSYIEGDRYASQLAETQAAALILPLNSDLQAAASERNIAWVESPHPRLAFAEAIALFYRPFQQAPGIHPTAVIDPSVTLGKDVAIAAHVVIQANAVVGDGVCIHPNVVLYPEVHIGNGTVLHANCVIHERTQIGAQCVIHSGSAIGSEGFGFVPTSQGWFKMEQSGRVVLEDGVEVGCNSAVDRPAVGETRIMRNTKIDNLVQVAHGCTVGENCALSSQVGLAGRVTLGEQVILAGQVGISNDVAMGDRAIATAKTGVHKDVPPGEIVSGYPAIPNKMWLKVSAVYNRLPEIYQTLRALKRQS
ncbi:MAG: UDP-3-O-(3-hydroxymyristoyl)glucosamine N-acyltransferase [Elainellaceae cyanobacterium]